MYSLEYHSDELVRRSRKEVTGLALSPVSRPKTALSDASSRKDFYKMYNEMNRHLHLPQVHSPSASLSSSPKSQVKSVTPDVNIWSREEMSPKKDAAPSEVIRSSSIDIDDSDIEDDERASDGEKHRIYLETCIRRNLPPFPPSSRRGRTQEMILNSRGLGKSVAPIVLDLSREDAITTLNIRDNRIGPGTAAELSVAISTCEHVNVLSAGGNCFRTAGSLSLGQVLGTTSHLSVIDLSSNRLSNTGVVALCKGLLNNRSVTSLNLSHNEISDEGGISLASVVQNSDCSIIYLNLSWNSIRGKGAFQLAQSLRANSTIEYIDLSWNNFGSTASALAAGELASAISVNCCLTYLNISDNQLKAGQMLEIMQSAKTNQTLMSLIAHGNYITEESVKCRLDCDSVPTLRATGIYWRLLCFDNINGNSCWEEHEDCWIANRYQPVTFCYTPRISGPCVTAGLKVALSCYDWKQFTMEEEWRPIPTPPEGRDDSISDYHKTLHYTTTVMCPPGPCQYTFISSEGEEVIDYTSLTERSLYHEYHHVCKVVMEKMQQDKPTADATKVLEVGPMDTKARPKTASLDNPLRAAIGKNFGDPLLRQELRERHRQLQDKAYFAISEMQQRKIMVVDRKDGLIFDIPDVVSDKNVHRNSARTQLLVDLARSVRESGVTTAKKIVNVVYVDPAVGPVPGTVFEGRESIQSESEAIRCISLPATWRVDSPDSIFARFRNENVDTVIAMFERDVDKSRIREYIKSFEEKERTVYYLRNSYGYLRRLHQERSVGKDPVSCFRMSYTKFVSLLREAKLLLHAESETDIKKAILDTQNMLAVKDLGVKQATFKTTVEDMTRSTFLLALVIAANILLTDADDSLALRVQIMIDSYLQQQIPIKLFPEYVRREELYMEEIDSELRGYEMDMHSVFRMYASKKDDKLSLEDFVGILSTNNLRSKFKSVAHSDENMHLLFVYCLETGTHDFLEDNVAANRMSFESFLEALYRLSIDLRESELEAPVLALRRTLDEFKKVLQ